MKPFFAGNRTETVISQRSDAPSVDALVNIWAQRNRALDVIRKYRTLTQEDVSMDTQPQQYSDQLDYQDKLDDPRNWTHRKCFCVKKSSENATQAEKEYYAIVNLYSSISEKMQLAYREAIIEMGYPRDLVEAVPVMNIPSQDEYVD